MCEVIKMRYNVLLRQLTSTRILECVASTKASSQRYRSPRWRFPRRRQCFDLLCCGYSSAVYRMHDHHPVSTRMGCRHERRPSRQWQPCVNAHISTHPLLSSIASSSSGERRGGLVETGQYESVTGTDWCTPLGGRQDVFNLEGHSSPNHIKSYRNQHLRKVKFCREVLVQWVKAANAKNCRMLSKAA